MTNILKRTITLFLLAVFAFLPFIFSGCNEKEIKNYKQQIAQLQTQKTALEEQNSELESEKSSLQQQNTELQNSKAELEEQVSTIHTPTEEERAAYSIIEDAVAKMRTSSDTSVLNSANNIEMYVKQFWGIELNKVLNLRVNFYGENYFYKIQIIINSNSIHIKTAAEGQYICYTINYNEESKNVVNTQWSLFVQSGDYAKVGTYTISDSTFSETEHTSGEIFETVKQESQAFNSVQTTVDSDFIDANV